MRLPTIYKEQKRAQTEERKDKAKLNKMADPRVKPCSVVLDTRQVENDFAKKRKQEHLFEIQKVFKFQACDELIPPEFVTVKQEFGTEFYVDPLNDRSLHEDLHIVKQESENRLPLPGENLSIKNCIKIELMDEISFSSDTELINEDNISNSDTSAVHNAQLSVNDDSNTSSVSVMNCSKFFPTASTSDKKGPLKTRKKPNKRRKPTCFLPKTVTVPTIQPPKDETHGIDSLMASNTKLIKRIEDKRNRCIFCKRDIYYPNFSKHLKESHNNEPVVLEILQLQSAPERNKIYNCLRVKGIFARNLEALKSEKRTINLKRQLPSNGLDSAIDTDILSGSTPCCLCCKCWFNVRKRSRHTKHCIHKIIPQIQNEASTDPYAAVITSEGFRGKLLTLLRFKTVRQTAHQDPLITEFGVYLCANSGSHIKLAMSELAKFLITARLLTNVEKSEDLQLEQLIDDRRWPLVIAAAKVVSDIGYTPQLAVNIGIHLKKIVDVLETWTSVRNDNLRLDNLSRFRKLLEVDYMTSIISKARAALDKTMTRREMPTNENLKTLHVHIEEHIPKAVDHLMETSSKSAYIRLAMLLQTKIFVMNIRKTEEIEQILLSTYINRNKKFLGPETAEVLKMLPSPAKHLVDHLQAIEVTSTRTQNVLVLLTQKIVSGLDVLRAYRKAVGIPSDNDYLFGCPDSNYPLRGLKSYRKVSAECNTELPQIMLPSRRRHLASMFLLFESTNSQIEPVNAVVIDEPDLKEDFDLDIACYESLDAPTDGELLNQQCSLQYSLNIQDPLYT